MASCAKHKPVWLRVECPPHCSGERLRSAGVTNMRNGLHACDYCDALRKKRSSLTLPHNIAHVRGCVWVCSFVYGDGHGSVRVRTLTTDTDKSLRRAQGRGRAQGRTHEPRTKTPSGYLAGVPRTPQPEPAISVSRNKPCSIKCSGECAERVFVSALGEDSGRNTHGYATSRAAT